MYVCYYSAEDYKKWLFCAGSGHDCKQCPAKGVTCYKSVKKDPFSKMYRSKQSPTSAATMPTTTLINLDSASSALQKRAVVFILVNNDKATALADTGSSGSFISDNYVKRLKLKVESATGNVSVASSKFPNKRTLHSKKINLLGESYLNTRLSALADLYCDMILGQNFVSQRSEVSFTLGVLGRAFVFPILLAAFHLLLPDSRLKTYCH